ncbi:ATP-binding protein [Aeromonas piscicola]|uniref:ATP-binding protein n=1 Tax=Aeromonas piscicola TaxID=600645 RepID=UPI0021F85173|nr:ATP-binding protein [Aeromonas piscicola]MCW0507853.1 ATP-binding protein [Aeromonas piscicola]
MKKILITGVFASGKTSLIELLKSTLQNAGKKVAVISEVARKCPLDLNQKQNFMSTSWLAMAQIINEMTPQSEHFDFIIYDRGLPDIIAHTQYILGGEQDELHLFEKLKELGEVSINNFHHIFLAMSSSKFKIQADGLRVDDVNYQKRLEEIHIDYLVKINSNYISLEEENGERLNQIMKIIC